MTSRLERLTGQIKVRAEWRSYGNRVHCRVCEHLAVFPREFDAPVGTTSDVQALSPEVATNPNLSASSAKVPNEVRTPIPISDNSNSDHARPFGIPHSRPPGCSRCQVCPDLVEVVEAITAREKCVEARQLRGLTKPESTEGGRRVSVLKRQEGAPVLLG